MTRPINPNISIPAAFAVDGQKTDFTAEKLQDGFDPVDPDVLAGDNLNKFIDDTYKGLNYSIDGVTDLYDVTDDLKDLSNLSVTGQAVLDGKASTDLSNLSASGEAHFANPALSNLDADGENRLHALKGYEDAGELLTDSEGLSDVTNYAHSTFNLSEFTVGGTATITDDGIAENFAGSGLNGVVRTTDDITFGSTFDFYFEFTTPQSTPASNQAFLITNSIQGISLVFLTNNRIGVQYGDGTQWITPNLIYGSNTLSLSTSYIGKLTYEGSKYELFTSVDNGLTWVKESEYASATQFLPTGKLNFGSGRGGVGTFTGSIDLKQVKLVNNGIPVFSGNKTGIDTYTINGSTVTIPYTLSKTGSKIVDSAYRTDVASVYSAFGYAPYYTLSDTDFTLPQGELYGMMQKYADNVTNQVCPDWDNQISILVTELGTTVVTGYTAPANGYITCTVGTISGGNLNYYINGTLQGTVAGSSGNCAGAITIPVNKGDVYSEELVTGAYNLSAARYFNPMKGV